jgi:integrase
MPSQSPRVPSYRHHKPSGQAVVTLSGRDIYLGKYNSAASRAEYNRLVSEWMAHGGRLPQNQASDLTVTELVAAFWKFAQLYYRAPDGRPTSEVANYKTLLRRLKVLYGRTRAADFGPLSLKALRQGLIDHGLARRTINQAVNRIRHVFKWGVENQLVEPGVFHGLQAVAGLRFGRSGAKETAPVKPVPAVFVDAVLSSVSPQVAVMIQLQCITGMRSGEVTIMRACDINTSGRVWVYTPERHKTAWHGHDRHVYLGPKAQGLIKPFLKADLQAYLFSPAEAEVERNEARFGVFSAGRKTPVFPSELKVRERRRASRKGTARKRPWREHYDTASYLRAVTRGIESANKARLAEARSKGIDADRVDLVPHWHPHQLRHNAATALRREHGIEVARIILGHRSAAITEVYAEVDHARAIDVMGRIG